MTSSLPSQDLQNNRLAILYEMAMAIGNTLDEQQLITSVAKVMLRKLNGIQIAFFINNLDAIDEVQQPSYCLPRQSLSDEHLFLCQQWWSQQKSLESNGLSGVISSSQTGDHKHIYGINLAGVGIVTITTVQPIDSAMLPALSPVCDKLSNAIKSCRSNQQLVSQEQALQTMLFELRQAQASRDAFLANMSHEIRTPLHGITGFIEQLAATPLNPQQQHFVEMTRQSSDMLLGIINDILDFSKIDAGKLVLERHPFNLQQALEPIIEMFQLRAKAKSIRFEVCYDFDAAVTYLSDPLRIKQILTNLISNAIKFTHQGQVRLLVKTVAEKDDKVRLKFRVSDTGIGMNAKHIARIGEPFLQGDESTTRLYGGTGLGLVICSRLLAFFDSCLRVESVLQKGSVFEFDLILDKVEKAQEPVSDFVFDTSQWIGRSVLVVEDNPVNQLLMETILKKISIDAILAENGLEALEMFRYQTFDLILMDINMPVMDGLEAMQEIRDWEAEKSLSRTPIIALTANVLQGDKVKYLDQGADAILAKPLQLNQLYEQLHHVFK
ncbi:response regulator [Thiomicrospira cyclica]|uniref:histidine kinase n=1 Tax=Thiomicrospira cyclica (strain DSM 14477 / JCM 11371 / ALM1) TaxID=717773 RepID=F6DBJ2_THICA|nr:response regulator [Thiomicrospira cyclica]AEG32394.1 histidine kinase [Thiomicrospira cyclica ALM1]